MTFGQMMNPLDPTQQQPQLPGVQPPTPQPPAMPEGSQAGPPKDEADLQNRQKGWAAFLQRLASPEVGQPILNAAATMMSPRMPGETHGYKIAQGLAVGAGTLAQQRDQATQEGFQERRVKIAEGEAATRKSAMEKQGMLIEQQIQNYKDANTPEERKKQLDILDARLKLINAQTKAAGEKGAGAGGYSPSGDVQKYVTLKDLYTRQGDPNPDARAASEAFGPAPKEFKLVSPPEFKLDAIMKYMSTVPGATPEMAEAAVKSSVDSYTAYHDAERSRIEGSKIGLPNAGSGDVSKDPIARYNAMLKSLGHPASPQEMEAARKRVATAFGLPPDWKP